MSNIKRNLSTHELDHLLEPSSLGNSTTESTNLKEDTEPDGSSSSSSSLALEENSSLDINRNDFIRNYEYDDSLLSRISRFFDGPVPPVEPTVTPIFKSIQYFPQTLSKRWPSHIKTLVICIFLSGWAFIFYQLAIHSILETPLVNGNPIPLLTCSATPAVWVGKNQYCGLNGEECGASELKEFFFKCPASCKEDSYTWSDTAVGPINSIYRPYVIGGNNTYRADSFICAAGLHHGISGDRTGFTGRIVFKGPHNNFLNTTAGSGIESLPFDSVFPYSYSFDDDFKNNYTVSGGRDLRFTIIWFNIVMSLIFGYFVQNGTVFFWTFSVLGFWTVVLASNPPLTLYELFAAELVSVGFRRFLPYMFGCYVIYMSSLKNQHTNLKASLTRSVLWVGGFWVSVLENYTFSALPVNRLTISDINKQRGGWITVISIAGFILFAAFGQAYIIWRLGKFKKYISVYILFIAGLAILANLDHQTLRIHHYIIGLILLPGVGFKTTPSLLFSGLLFGLYVSGVARWDFDSIVQTEAQLNRGDAMNIGGLPELVTPLFEYSNITGPAENQLADIIVTWKNSLSAEDAEFRDMWNGYSLIVNDVEQYRGNETSFSLKDLVESDTWNIDPKPKERKVYVRLAFANLHPSAYLHTGDYTKAGTIYLDEERWTKPSPGPS